jgi:hypothetical protein
LTFNSERFDEGGLHSVVSNTGRLTAPVDGDYFIGTGIHFVNAGGALRVVRIRLNGTTIIAANEQAPTSGDTTAVHIGTFYRLTAGEYAEVTAFQNSGAAINILSEPSASPEFWMVRIPGT